MAVGLCSIWGVMDVINFAHGEYVMISMYVTYWLGFLANVDPLVSMFAGGLFIFILGALTYRSSSTPSASRFRPCWRPSAWPCS